MSNPLDLIAAQTYVTDINLLSSIDRGQVVSASLSSDKLTIPVVVSDDYFNADTVRSDQYNVFFSSVVTDLIRLFAATNDNDVKLTALEKLGVSDLSTISSNLDRMESSIQGSKDLQLGYTAGYTIYSRVDFIDDSYIERNPIIIGSHPIAKYDPHLQSITLGTYLETDTLHSSQGAIVVDVSLSTQLGRVVNQYEHLRTPQHAIDLGSTSYWAEVVLSDDLVSIPWPTPDSIYAPSVDIGVLNQILTGTICEYNITYRQPTTWTNLVIKPFCELPVNLAAVFVTKRDGNIINPGETRIVDSIQAGYGIYLITEYASNRTNGNLFINQTARLFFPIQEECTVVTIVFHQPHYTREIFALSSDNTQQQSLWQQMLSHTPVLGIPQILGTNYIDLTSNKPLDLVGRLANAIGSNLSGTLTNPISTLQTYSKYQYIYGAYDIELNEKRYSTNSTFISTPLTSIYNLVQGTIVADYDLPLVSTKNIASSAFAGDITQVPLNFKVPAATLSFDMTFGNGQKYYPLAPLDAIEIHEPFNVISSQLSLTLRLQARPGTNIFLTSFDGLGNANVIAQVIAGSIIGNSPTVAIWPNTILQAPGFYVVTYTPIDTSHWVDFGNIAEAANMMVQEIVNFTGNDLPHLQSMKLPNYPYINTNRINGKFEPNGNTLISEYVPLTISISSMPIVFPNIIDITGHPTTISSFTQDIDHTDDLYTINTIKQEVLYCSSSNPNAGTIFTSKYSNWNTDPSNPPQLFSIAPNSPSTVIPNMDATGNNIWVADYLTGVIRFQGSNAAVSGQIALTYSYNTTSFTLPKIVNRTDLRTSFHAALTPFDPSIYPVIEYILVDNNIYFNLDIPASAIVTIGYSRLFDSVRVRANFVQIDPINESATAHLYGFSLLARDANGTSLDSISQTSVVWGDLELESLGIEIQPNPGIGIIAGNSSSSAGLPSQTQVNWYRIVNSGSVTDTLRASYDASNGTTVFWDYTGQRNIIADSGQSNEVSYRIMRIDGSNTIILSPGESCVLGICNFLVPPNTSNSINPATIYSGKTPDYLETTDWLLQASLVTKTTSIAAVVIS